MSENNKRVVASGDVLKSRREGVKALVTKIFEENKEEMHLGGVVKKWEAMTGQKHDRISWYDCLHAIEDLAKEGKVTVSTPEKGRVQYKAVEDKQLTLGL